MLKNCFVFQLLMKNLGITYLIFRLIIIFISREVTVNSNSCISCPEEELYEKYIIRVEHAQNIKCCANKFVLQDN